MQKFPKSLADAIQEIKSLRVERDGLRNLLDTKSAEYQNERHGRITAEKETDEARKNFVDLKERLHNSEMEVARQRGYLERVREDDAVADPLVEIEGPDGKRFVSKRHPSPPMLSNGFDHAFEPSLYGREKRKHWTSY